MKSLHLLGKGTKLSEQFHQWIMQDSKYVLKTRRKLPQFFMKCASSTLRDEDLHLSIILPLCIILSSTALLQHVNASDSKKPGGVENLGFTTFSFPHRDDFSPLKQFKAGVPTYGIACNNLKLVIKKSDDTPVCVKPQNVQSLLVRGWGTCSVHMITKHLTHRLSLD